MYCDEIVPFVQPQFLEGGKVFEQFFGVVYWFALLLDHRVVLFVPSCLFSVVRFPWRALSTAVDGCRMLVVTSFSCWRDGNRSNSSPGIALASLSVRSVGSSRGLDYIASCGQWLN